MNSAVTDDLWRISTTRGVSLVAKIIGDLGVPEEGLVPALLTRHDVTW
jgi:hypothetical protein